MIALILFLVDVDTILTKTEEHYVNLRSYYVEFVQTYCDSEEGTCKRYIGRVAYKAPNKMRIEIEGAEDRIDLIDGEYLWNYFPKEGKVLKTKIRKEFFDLKSLIRDCRERFNYRLIKATPPYEIEFLPKSEDEGIRKMILVISKSYLIKGVTTIDPFGNESKFDFNRFSLNRPISDKIFRLKLPKDVEVIEQ